MILGHSELRKLIKSHNLITGLSKREQDNPEGCGFDLQLDKIFRLEGKAFIGLTERETPKFVEVASYDSKKKSTFTIRPGRYYMTKTVEEINLPENITALVTPRGTTVRSGLILRTWNAAPGYKGTMYFGLYNAGNISVKFELGARYAHILFFEVKGKPVNKYRGQWQGGRATTKGREKQI